MWHRKPHARADDATMQPLPESHLGLTHVHGNLGQMSIEAMENRRPLRVSSDHDGCTADYCTQTDVPMIARTHTPRTCPALATP
jgi:hypothetical protein